MCKLIIAFMLIIFYKPISAQNLQVLTSGKSDTAFVKFINLNDTSQIHIRLSHYYEKEKKQDTIIYFLRIIDKGDTEKPKFVYIGKNINGKTYYQSAKPTIYFNRKLKSTKDFSIWAIEILDAFSYGGKVKEYCYTGYKLEKNDLHNSLSFILIPNLGLLNLQVNIEGDMVDSSFKETYKLNTINNVKADLYFKQVCNIQKK